MDDQNTDQKSCIDVRYVSDNKELMGAVCVALSKNVGRKERKVDIICMPEGKGAWSVRSTTELMNVLLTGRSRLKRERALRFRCQAVVCPCC